jgi:hypothetical protein
VKKHSYATAALVLAGIALLAGLVPGTRATLDHCYVTYDRQEQQHSRCFGHWRWLVWQAQGRVYGAPVATDWQVIEQDPDENYEWEVAIPASGSQVLIVPGPGPAVALAGLGPLLRTWPVCLCLLTLPLLGLLVATARKAARERRTGE